MLSGIAKIILMAAGGAFLVCGFAPFSYWLITFICPALLYASLVKSTPRHAFLLGLIFGLFFFGFGASWTFNSIHEFGHAPVILSAFLAGLLVVVLALFPACVAYLFAATRCNSCLDFVSALAFATLWTLFEWLRSWLFTGFPWLLLGHAHHSSPLHGVIPIFGTYGATWLVLLTSCFFVVAVLGKRTQKITAGISLALVFLSLTVANQVVWTEAEDEEIGVALIQGSIPQEMKWEQAKRSYIMGRYLQLSESHLDADVLVWPETAIPTYYHVVEDSFIKEVEQVAAAEGTDFLTGVFTHDPASGNVYNSVAVLGEETGFYQKRHLVPFGEYIPLRSIMPSFWERYIQVPMADLSSGEGRPLVSLKGYPVGVSICYEAVYGNEIIQALPEAKFLVNVSNDGWFGDSLAPHQHLEITRSRAVETGRYLLRATNTGISAVITPNGSIVDRSVQFQEDVVRADIQPYSGLTPFSRWGNWGIITVLLGILLAICVRQWRLAERNRSIIY